MLDQFTAGMLQGCLEVLTGMPGTVFKACDVLSVVAQRNGEEWKQSTMMHVLKQVLCFCLSFSNVYLPFCRSFIDVFNRRATGFSMREKLFQRNFFIRKAFLLIDDQTRQLISSSQQVDLPVA